MSPKAREDRTILLLGAGELGRELAIAAQRMGLRVVAVDRYDDAPAMSVAHVREVVPMFDATALEGVVRTHRPLLVIPELEAIRGDKLVQLEGEGFSVIPNAETVRLTMDREGIRRLASEELGIPTSRYRFADSEASLREACDDLGYPCVVKPIMSYSGRGQSVVLGPARVERAWAFAREEGSDPRDGAGGRPAAPRVIVEELIEFHSEITLLTVREGDGATRFLDPVGHRQERGGYRESWSPAAVGEDQLDEAKRVARTLTDRLGGRGVFGIEFFITDDAVIFSELSPGPHDTGMVTLASQDLSQFEIHLRAALELPIPSVRTLGPAASAVILARDTGDVLGYDGVGRALLVDTARIHLFGKPTAHPYRRMGVALASAGSVAEARARALEAAARVEVRVR